MSQKRSAADAPPCYAMTVPGLEDVASDEITRDLRGEIKRTGQGLVVFRVPHLDESILHLRTVEDVFLFAWGTNELSHRAVDLEKIRRWTAHDADWGQLLRIHHALRPKPKGKPTYHLVTQMVGKHVYRRVDARNAMVKGLVGKFPPSWKYAEDNASVEFWLTINNSTAICGLRLSDRTMRHRTYKLEHLPASLRPTVAAAMVRLADIKPGHTVLDPMCGAGTLLAECLAWAEQADVRNLTVQGGDLERNAVVAAAANLRRLGLATLTAWDARRLPVPSASVDRLVSNPPFGKQMSRAEDIGPLYQKMLLEYDRVLKPYGRAVLLVSEQAALREAAQAVGWKPLRLVRVRVLGQPAVISTWRKGLTVAD